MCSFFSIHASAKPAAAMAFSAPRPMWNILQIDVKKVTFSDHFVRSVQRKAGSIDIGSEGTKAGTNVKRVHVPRVERSCAQLYAQRSIQRR